MVKWRACNILLKRFCTHLKCHCSINELIWMTFDLGVTTITHFFWWSLNILRRKLNLSNKSSFLPSIMLGGPPRSFLLPSLLACLQQHLWWNQRDFSNQKVLHAFQDTERAAGYLPFSASSHLPFSFTIFIALECNYLLFCSLPHLTMSPSRTGTIPLYPNK